MTHNKIDLVIPVTLNHLKVLIPNLQSLKAYLPISKIVVIGNLEIKDQIRENASLHFIDERELVDIDALREVIEARSKDEKVRKRFGWYLQQFLKMAYSSACEDDYYLLWDCDTIPLKRIALFDEKDKPYIDYKTEYYPQYFETMNRLLPGYKKIFEGSFIAEHMLVNTTHMRELVKQIEKNSIIKGNTFCEKIINAIEIKWLVGSGFSEFETFGTFLYHNYREYYSFRQWKSMRNGGFFFEAMRMTQKERSWLANNYHAISFEQSDKLSVFSNVVSSRWFMLLFSSKILVYFSFLLRLYRKIVR